MCNVCEQVMIAFMVLLKTISMRLNANLVGIFFHGSNVDDGLPLYTQATKFIGHRCFDFYSSLSQTYVIYLPKSPICMV